MKNKFLAKRKILCFEVWGHEFTMSKLFDESLNHKNTDIIVDCSKESQLAPGHYWQADITQYAEMQAKAKEHNAIFGNRISVVTGNFKLMPSDGLKSDINLVNIDLPAKKTTITPNDSSWCPFSCAIAANFFDHVESWPTYFIVWHGAKVAKKALKQTKRWNDSKIINKTFMIKNRVPKQHRVLLLDELAKRGVLEGNLYSLYEFEDKQISNVINCVVEGKPSLHIGERTMGRRLGDNEDWYASPPDNQDEALIEVVAETSPDSTFYTEKTVWPIAYMKPFVISGCQYINHNLQQYGFKLYDELIDYSFDKLSSPRARIKGLADELARIDNLNLTNTEYHELNETLRPKLEHNMAVYLEMVFNDPCMPRLVKELGHNEEVIRQQVTKEGREYNVVGYVMGSWKTFVDRDGGNGHLMDIVRTNPYLSGLMGRQL